jgi:MFS family permease
MPAPKGLGAILGALRERNFAIYTAGNGLSLVGTWIQRIAVGWVAWELTGSATWLGAVAFADLFPAVVLGVLGGAIADRVSQVRILVVGHVLMMLQALALAGLTLAGLTTVELLFALVLLGGMVTAFNQPARLALVPSLVPRQHLSTAVAINSINFNLARFIGPVIAGALIVASGAGAAFLANALSFLAFLLALSRLRLPPRLGDGGRASSLLADIAEGIRYTLSHQGLGPLLLLLLVFAVGVRPLAELLPGFADAVFGRGAPGLAALSAAIGVGAIGGGYWLAQRGQTGGLWPVVLAAAVAMGLCGLAFVATASFLVALLAAAAAGAAMVISGAGGQTIVHMTVEGRMRGRVLSLYGMMFRGGPAIGALIMGAIADLVGLRLALAAGAVCSLLLCALVLRRRARIGEALSDSPAGP